MSEMVNLPERDKSELETVLEHKIEWLLRERLELGLAIKDLYLNLEKTIYSSEKADFSKEDLHELLSSMISRGKIDTVVSNRETHYIIKKRPKWPGQQVQHKSPDVQTVQNSKFEPVNSWIGSSRTEISKWLAIFGVITGLLIGYQINGFEILKALMVISITVSALIEIVTASKQSKENVRYNAPIYGIFGLAFNVIGIILLIVLGYGNSYYGFIGLQFLYIIPFALIGLFCCIGGIYKYKDSRPHVALIGLFLSVTLLMISVWPLLYVLFAFIFMIFWGM